MKQIATFLLQIVLIVLLPVEATVSNLQARNVEYTGNLQDFTKVTDLLRILK